MRPLARILLSAAIAALLLGLLFRWGGVRPADFGAALRRLTLGDWLLALAIHAGIYAVRAARFRALLPAPGQVRYPGVLAASAAHNLAAYVLPAKTGEAALVVYLKAHCGVSGSAGLASLLVSRLLDLATLAAALALACLLLAVMPGREPPGWTGLGAGILLGVALAFLVLGARASLLADLFGGLVRGLGLGRTRLGARALDIAERVAGALAEAGGRGRYPLAVGLSAVVWSGVFLFYAVLARATGLDDVGLLEATFGSSLAVATNLLPINAFAAFGTQEAGWTLGFGLLGIDREVALSTGVAVHLIQLADVVLLGVLGHLAMGLLPGKAPAPPAEPPSAGGED